MVAFPQAPRNPARLLGPVDHTRANRPFQVQPQANHRACTYRRRGVTRRPEREAPDVDCGPRVFAVGRRTLHHQVGAEALMGHRPKRWRALHHPPVELVDAALVHQEHLSLVGEADRRPVDAFPAPL